MFKLAYVSVATRTLSSVDLQNILETAITSNRDADITGILLFNGTNFMQVLEGPQEEVEKIFAKICDDDRHRNVVVIYREKTGAREFEEAPMLLQIVPAAEPPFRMAALQRHLPRGHCCVALSTTLQLQTRRQSNNCFAAARRRRSK